VGHRKEICMGDLVVLPELEAMVKVLQQSWPQLCPALTIEVAFFALLASLLLTLDRGHTEGGDARFLDRVTNIGQELALIFV